MQELKIVVAKEVQRMLSDRHVWVDEPMTTSYSTGGGRVVVYRGDKPLVTIKQLKEKVHLFPFFSAIDDIWIDIMDGDFDKEIGDLVSKIKAEIIYKPDLGIKNPYVQVRSRT